ncbi:MAG: AI-2E family transporter [Myxococcales bacterium]|nr:AI-2E family transporter [Myxococcales bacterium]
MSDSEEPTADTPSSATEPVDSAAASAPAESGATLKQTLQPVVMLLGILTAICVAAALKATAGVLIPLVLAIFISYAVTPLTNVLSSYRIPEVLTLPVILLVMVGIMFLLDLVIVSTVEDLSERAPEYAEQFQSMIDDIDAKLGLRGAIGLGGGEGEESQLVQSLFGAATDLTAEIFGTALGFVANLVLILTYTAFIMTGRRALAANLTRAVSHEKADEVRDMLKQINQQVQRYIGVKTVVSLATGILMGLTLWAFGVDFALFWGLLGFLLNYIPNVGSAIAAILPIVLSLLQFDGLGRPLAVAATLIGIQQVIGNVIEPAVQGERLNLSPIVVLFSLVFFAWLWGFWGAVLSVPLVASLKIFFYHVPSLKPLAVMMEKTAQQAK